MLFRSNDNDGDDDDDDNDDYGGMMIWRWEQ